MKRIYSLIQTGILFGILNLSAFSSMPPADTLGPVPEIIVSPNSAILGQQLTLDISGQMTHFAQASNTVYFYTYMTASPIYYYANAVKVINDEYLQASFNISCYQSVNTKTVVV